MRSGFASSSGKSIFEPVCFVLWCMCVQLQNAYMGYDIPPKAPTKLAHRSYYSSIHFCCMLQFFLGSSTHERTGLILLQISFLSIVLLTLLTSCQAYRIQSQ